MEKSPYYYWAEKEIGNEDPIIDSYAKLIVQEYDKFFGGEITLDQFKANTPKIEVESPLNYIRDRIIEWFPN